MSHKGGSEEKSSIINEKGRKMIIEGGYTGKIENMNPSLVDLLVKEGLCPCYFAYRNK